MLSMCIHTSSQQALIKFTRKMIRDIRRKSILVSSCTCSRIALKSLFLPLREQLWHPRKPMLWEIFSGPPTMPFVFLVFFVVSFMLIFVLYYLLFCSWEYSTSSTFFKLNKFNLYIIYATNLHDITKETDQEQPRKHENLLIFEEILLNDVVFKDFTKDDSIPETVQLPFNEIEGNRCSSLDSIV